MAFDVITPKKLATTLIPIVLGSIYTVAANTRTFLKNIDVCNANSYPVKITLYLVPTGSSADTSNILLKDLNIPEKSNFQWSGIQILEAGATIQAIADLTDCSAHISGGEAL